VAAVELYLKDLVSEDETIENLRMVIFEDPDQSENENDISSCSVSNPFKVLSPKI